MTRGEGNGIPRSSELGVEMGSGRAVRLPSLDLGLRDRVCVVTGSTSGIGRTVAHMLAEEGAKVVTSGRRETGPGVGEALHVGEARKGQASGKRSTFRATWHSRMRRPSSSVAHSSSGRWIAW